MPRPETEDAPREVYVPSRDGGEAMRMMALNSGTDMQQQQQQQQQMLMMQQQQLAFHNRASMNSTGRRNKTQQRQSTAASSYYSSGGGGGRVNASAGGHRAHPSDRTSRYSTGSSSVVSGASGGRGGASSSASDGYGLSSDGQRRPRNSTEAAAEAKEMEDERERLQGMASAANREIASLKKSMMVSFSFHKCVKDGNDE